MTQGEQSWASTDNSLPSGLVVVIENKPQPDLALDLRPLNNPFISGVALQIRWRDLDPVKGKPEWSKLDQLFAAAESSKKWVQLLIFFGFFLLRGPWKGQRPNFSQYNMALAKARSRGFRCRGTGGTLFRRSQCVAPQSAANGRAGRPEPRPTGRGRHPIFERTGSIAVGSAHASRWHPANRDGS
jgi:hypothetical protein